MDYLEFDGIKYSRSGKKWADEHGLVACDIIQEKLNKKFSEKLDFEKMAFEELLKTGDQFKATHTLALAIKCYEYAFECSDLKKVKAVLPRLTSCYRQMGQPQKAVDILVRATGAFGERVMSQPLYTSGAAAYCDLGKYKMALKACNQAYKLSGNNPDGELKAVYGRIRKEKPELFQD